MFKWDDIKHTTHTHTRIFGYSVHINDASRQIQCSCIRNHSISSFAQIYIYFVQYKTKNFAFKHLTFCQRKLSKRDFPRAEKHVCGFSTSITYRLNNRICKFSPLTSFFGHVFPLILTISLKCYSWQYKFLLVDRRYWPQFHCSKSVF